MEYPRAEAFINIEITINGNPIIEPISKLLLKNVTSLPCYYHNTLRKKFRNWKFYGNTLPQMFSFFGTFFRPLYHKPYFTTIFFALF